MTVRTLWAPAFALVPLVAFFGCGRDALAPDAVATWSGGVVRIGDLESRLRELPEGERLRADLDIVSAYRRLARSAVLEEQLLARSSSEDTGEIPEAERRERSRLRQVAETYLRRVVLPGLEPEPVSEETLRAEYDSHPDNFRQQEAVLLHTLLLRHEGGAEADSGAEAAWRATRERLEALRAAHLAGEPFPRLARVYSQSETAPLGGQVGWITRGVLPAALEKVAFSLPAGGVSRPLATGDGGMLLWAAERVDEEVYPYEQVRRQIREGLTRRRQQAALAAWLERQQPSAELEAWSDEQFLEAISSQVVDEQAVVLRVGELTWSLGELLGTPPEPGAGGSEERGKDLDPVTGTEGTDPVGGLTGEMDESSGALDVRQQRGLAALRQWRNWAVIADAAGRSGWLDRPDVVALVERGVAAREEQRAADRALRREIGEELRRRADAAADGEGPLHDWFVENRASFRSEVEYEIQTLRLTPPHGTAAARWVIDAESWLRSGHDQSLTELAQSREGDLGPVVRVPFSRLSESLPQKLVHQVVQLGGTGRTPPVRIEGELWLAEVSERHLPRERGYAEVRPEVVRAYQRQVGDRLRREVAQRLLDDAEFVFHEEQLRRQFGLESEPESGGSSSRAPEGASDGALDGE